jgi:DNA-binding transcriptional ArsR family regulator
MFVVPKTSTTQPDVWQALADPTRRALIDRLAQGPKTTSQLCEGMPMSRFGVMKHLGILERARLVIARRHGRLRMNHLNVAQLHSLQSRWLSARSIATARGIQEFSAHIGAVEMAQSDPGAKAGVVEVALEWPVAASVQKVWNALFNQPEKWWPMEHRAGGTGAVMKFEPQIGGRFYEERPDGGGVLWYTVYALEPMRSVDLRGNLASRYGGPATSLIHIEIEPAAADGTSILKLTDSTFGRLGPEIRASLHSGWQAIVGEGLVAHLAR